MEFWNDISIDRSFKLLYELKKRLDFVLIGGWAVYFLTRTIKSKDIDIIVDFENLAKLRSELNLKKNEFLKEYEAEIEGISVDIYVPYYSRLVVPVEEILKNVVRIEGFKIPRPEILLLLKQQAEMQRKDSVKGQKDRVDIICLMKSGKIDWKYYKDLLTKHKLKEYEERLKEIIKTAKIEFEYIGVTNPREIRKLKEEVLRELA